MALNNLNMASLNVGYPLRSSKNGLPGINHQNPRKVIKMAINKFSKKVAILQKGVLQSGFSALFK